MNELAVQPLLEQIVRIHDALQGHGLHPEMITNPRGEAIAVVARGSFDPDRVMGSVGLHRLIDKFDALQTFPVAGAVVYPRDFLDTMDVIVQAAAERPGWLATRLGSGSKNDSDSDDLPGQSLGLHCDYIGSAQYREKEPYLHGLNVHATRRGVVRAQFGMVRGLEYDMAFHEEEDVHGREARNKLILAAAQPFSEPVILRPGDQLVFQAQQHHERRLVPLAHEFTTVEGPRRSEVFRPHIGEPAVVMPKRARLASELALQAFGYVYDQAE
jgi:hypothetical protein